MRGDNINELRKGYVYYSKSFLWGDKMDSNNYEKYMKKYKKSHSQVWLHNNIIRELRTAKKLFGKKSINETIRYLLDNFRFK